MICILAGVTGAVATDTYHNLHTQPVYYIESVYNLGEREAISIAFISLNDPI